MLRPEFMWEFHPFRLFLRTGNGEPGTRSPLSEREVHGRLHPENPGWAESVENPSPPSDLSIDREQQGFAVEHRQRESECS